MDITPLFSRMEKSEKEAGFNFLESVGDFKCDRDVDGTDASLFKQDFGRSSIQNPCPVCEAGVEWCGY